jgi:hypothetical protein
MDQTMNDKKNKPQFISVPFKASSPNGMMEYNGIAKFSPAGIVIKEVRIALNEIFDIRFRKGIYKFFAQVQFRLQSFSKLSELPNDSGKVKLKIKRADFELAQKAVEQTLQYMSGNEQPVLPDNNQSNEQLPPVQTSVNELFDTEKLDKKTN